MTTARLKWALYNQQANKRYLPLRVSFDNASPQAYANTMMFMRPDEEVWGLPAWSPDMHKCIEHVFGWLKTAVHRAAYAKFGAQLGKASVSDWHQLVYDTFFTLKPCSVAKDVQSLPALYEMIAHPKGQSFMCSNGKVYQGTGGDYPCKAYR